MASNDAQPLVTIEELSRHSRLSVSTIHRLKRAGRIPYYQPAGEGGRLLFPPDAIERAGSSKDQIPAAGSDQGGGDQRLSGPRPAWMQ